MPATGALICLFHIEITRAFVRLRRMLVSNAELSRKLSALEKKYDDQFKAVFDAIRELMPQLEPRKKRRIGFAPWEKNEADPFGTSSFWRKNFG